jgi:hypothetical protein
VDGTVHGVSEGAVHDLVLLNQRFPLEGLRHDPRFIVIFGTRQVDELDPGVGQGRKQQPSNAFRSHENPSLARGYLTYGGRPVNLRAWVVGAKPHLGGYSRGGSGFGSLISRIASLKRT